MNAPSGCAKEHSANQVPWQMWSNLIKKHEGTRGAFVQVIQAKPRWDGRLLILFGCLSPHMSTKFGAAQDMYGILLGPQLRRSCIPVFIFASHSLCSIEHVTPPSPISLYRLSYSPPYTPVPPHLPSAGSQPYCAGQSVVRLHSHHPHPPEIIGGSINSPKKPFRQRCVLLTSSVPWT